MESVLVLEPVMFESQYNNSLMRNPDYLSSWFGDFYLEPVSLEQGETDEQNIVVLVKDEPQTYRSYHNYFPKI